MIEPSAYFYVGDQRVPLIPNPQLFAVRLTRAAQIDTLRLSEEVWRMLGQSQPVTFLPRDGLHIYRHDTAPQISELLRRDPGIAHAVSVYHRAPGGEDTVIITTRLLVQFRADLGEAQIAAALEEFKLRIVEPLPYASPHGFMLEASPGGDGLGAVSAANTLVERRLVVFAEPDLIQSRHWKDDGLPDLYAAPYLGNQWHLKAVHAQDAWKYTEGSAAIRIAILDDGLDLGHEEFTTPVALGQPKVADQFDFATGTADASPRTYIDNHGTACAGVAAASGVNASGVAPGCRLIIARVPDYLGVSDEAKMFVWAADAGTDVISCSWGPADGLGATVLLPTATRLAIRYCVTQGRAGKGIPIFWAAGNGTELVSGDGYASNPDVMAIAACTAAEAPAHYSDYGPEIFACAPSSGGLGQPAIFTTDRRGPAGYNPGNAQRGDAPGDYTNSFGGTSSAAPLAAGIAALALSVNPALTVQQVRDLLARTADRIGGDTQYDLMGHSDHYGHGRLNAAGVVEGAAHPAPVEAVGPVILAPSVWSRVDSPPMFHVDPTPNLYYVVEVVTQPELFDKAEHGFLRNADNFYGSWSDSPFQTSATYVLPAAVWGRLRPADRLWYRVGSSSSAITYSDDYVVSTPDDQGASAPSISIASGIGAPPQTPGSTRSTISDLSGMPRDTGEPWIEGPARWDRAMGPPTFRLELHGEIACRVELAVDSTFEKRFTSDWIKPGRIAGLPCLPFQAHTVPVEVWDTLRAAEKLYYRLTVSEKDQPAYAFVVELTGVVHPDLDQLPLVRASESLWRAAGGLEWVLVPSSTAVIARRIIVRSRGTGI
jgi:subtilisin family serine protease